MVLFLHVFQSSLFKQVEEMEQDSLITLNIERLIGTYGRVTVEWIANGSTSDVFPASGMVCDDITDREALRVLCQIIGADVLRHDSRCPALLLMPASCSFPLILAACISGWHIILQHHSCSSRTRCALQALEMYISSTLIPSPFFPAVSSTFCVK